ncbi:alpha/beta fold hydrolase [Methylomonas sp. HW2-6]|uniref:alpha/beta fold hydrolase n=1 Tax=Methylomonas sp. HW2-6 TaxID=3376687 RepID=UPI004042531C
MASHRTEDWILLRGLCREAGHWGNFPSLLQSAFPAATVHCIDLPGAGTFHRETSPKRIEEISEWVRQRAAEAGMLQRPVNLLALSLGGMVAWEWLQRYPGDIAGVALLNTSFAGLSPFFHRLRWQSYRRLLQIMLEKDVYRRELAIIRLTSNRRDYDHELAETWAHIQRQRPVSVRNALRQLYAASRYRPTACANQTPVLLLSGKGDRIVAQECSKAIHGRWNVPWLSHPWAGHDLILDDGIWVAERLQDWTKQLSGIT